MKRRKVEHTIWMCGSEERRRRRRSRWHVAAGENVILGLSSFNF
ncbi:uncharacterized protein G2W53_033279 [Senna tora]|uniref:Uncharacterized protein n=1 Tax=Senna tora TaxID=362788 RepID=A0A834SXA1_9FABA|nr:uncharacterized protein G2W53_033279 [Senna tora]